MAEIIRIAICGAGNRTLPRKPETSNWFGWMDIIHRHPEFELVGVQDVADDALARAVERGYITWEKTFKNPEVMLNFIQPAAILVTTPVEFHSRILLLGIERNLHLMVEKPFVTDIAEGEEIVEKIKAKGKVSLVVQNWRYKDVGRGIRDFIASGSLGTVGHIFFRYIRNRENPNYPAYIFEEAFPLLYAMGIHHFDLLRYILDDEVTAVTGRSFKPPWSRYNSVTGHTLFMETRKGVAISYSGTISSQNGGLPQESLVIEGANGTLVNNSDWLEPPLLFYRKGKKEPVNITDDVQDGSVRAQYDAADMYLLENFRAAIQEGMPSTCPASDSLKSLKLLEAARRACQTGKTIQISE
jgi:predicted dehydrogenase